MGLSPSRVQAVAGPAVVDYLLELAMIHLEASGARKWNTRRIPVGSAQWKSW